MRIHTRVVIDMRTGEVLDDDWYEYDGPIAYCGGGAEPTTTATPTNTTNTTKSSPWGPQQPHLKRIFGAAQNQFQGGGPQYFPGQNYIDPSKQTTGAIQGQAGLARSGMRNQYGAGTVDQAQLALRQQMNPEQDVNRFMSGYGNDIRDQINAQFMKGGGGFSPGHAKALSSGLGEAASKLYSDSQGRALQAAGMAPGLAAQDYGDAAQLGMAGRTMEGYQSDRLRGAMERYNFNQMRPQEALARYAGNVSGNFGGTSSSKGSSVTSNTTYTNPWANTLGYAATGAGIGGAIGGPWGAGVGAAGGLLGGLFS